MKYFYQDKYTQYRFQTVAEKIFRSFKTRSHDIVTVKCRGAFISLVNLYKTSKNYPISGPLSFTDKAWYMIYIIDICIYNSNAVL